MNSKSTLLHRLALGLPVTMPEEYSIKPAPQPERRANPEVEQLQQRLATVRSASMAASRNGDVRLQGRLTQETAEILRQLRVAQGLPADAELVF